MAVVVDSGPVAADDLLRHVPRERWHELMLARKRFLEIKLSYDCRCLVQFVNEAGEMYQSLGFASVEDMIREGYGLKPEEISVAVEWLKLNPPDEPISFDQAFKLGKQGAPPGNNNAAKDRDKTTLAIQGLKYGTKAHWIARLEREGFDELAAVVKRGELSANAVATQLGWRKKPVRHCPNCGHEW